MDLSLNKLPWYGQVGLFVALGLMAVGGFYYVYASPRQADLAERQKTLDTLRADMNKGLAIARRLPQFKAQVTELEQKLESLKAVLPEQKDFADLLRSVEALARQSNLRLNTFKPAPTVTKQLHAEWPINLQIDGTYHNLGLFFDRVSKFPRIINVTGINIKAKDKPDGNSTIVAECVATTFVLLDAAKAAAAQVPPGGAPAPVKTN
jgi:type IV pilus assembly protein PilO